MTVYRKWWTLELAMWGTIALTILLVLLNQRVLGALSLVAMAVLIPTFHFWKILLRCRRCGEVISKTEKTLFGLRIPGVRTFFPPETCPGCGANLKEKE